jgi:Bacterial PH domain
MGSVRAARDKRSGASGGPQTFRSPTAVIVWWVWVLFAVANAVDLAVQGRDHGTLVAAGILLMATGVAYVCAQRPRILADQAGITVVNPLRDHHAGWATVTEVDVADLVRVHCQLAPGRTKAIYAWAVHYSRRKKMMAQVKASRMAAREASGRPAFGLGSYGGNRLSGFGVSASGYGRSAGAEPTPAAEADAERIVSVLNEYVTAARAELAYAAGDPATPAAGPAPSPEPAAPATPAASPGTPQAAWLDPLRSTWSRRALLTLLVPALLLLLVIFV